MISRHTVYPLNFPMSMNIIFINKTDTQIFITGEAGLKKNSIKAINTLHNYFNFFLKIQHHSIRNVAEKKNNKINNTIQKTVLVFTIKHKHSIHVHPINNFSIPQSVLQDVGDVRSILTFFFLQGIFK